MDSLSKLGCDKFLMNIQLMQHSDNLSTSRHSNTDNFRYGTLLTTAQLRHYLTEEQGDQNDHQGKHFQNGFSLTSSKQSACFSEKRFTAPSKEVALVEVVALNKVSFSSSEIKLGT